MVVCVVCADTTFELEDTVCDGISCDSPHERGELRGRVATLILELTNAKSVHALPAHTQTRRNKHEVRNPSSCPGSDTLPKHVHTICLCFAFSTTLLRHESTTLEDLNARKTSGV